MSIELQEYYYLSVDYDGIEIFLVEEGGFIVGRASNTDDTSKWYVGNHSSGIGSGIKSGSTDQYIQMQASGEVTFDSPMTVFVLGEEDEEGRRTVSFEDLYLSLPEQYDSSASATAETTSEGKKQKWKFAKADGTKGN